MHGHYACEADYDRPEQPLPDPHGHPADEADLEAVDTATLRTWHQDDALRYRDGCPRCRGLGQVKYRRGWDWCRECQSDAYDVSPNIPGTTRDRIFNAIASRPDERPWVAVKPGVYTTRDTH